MREQGMRTPMLEQEVANMLADRAQKKQNNISDHSKQLDDIFKNDETQTADLIDEKDLKFLATTRVRLSQGDILKMYVKNASDLNLKQRRQVMAHIQA